MSYVVTSALSTRLLRGQLGYMKANGFKVELVCSPPSPTEPIPNDEIDNLFTVPMAREPRLAHDLLALVRLLAHFVRHRPSVVNASTPKAALIGLVAAWVLRVPCRVYVVRGLRYENVRGRRRQVLRLSERVSAACATHIICVSSSLRELYVQEGLSPADKVRVLANGSSNGVDAKRFAWSPDRGELALRLRKAQGIPPGVPVVGFVGRLTRDKGLLDLLPAFKRIREAVRDARLLLVGPDEAAGLPDIRVAEELRDTPGVHWMPFTEDVAACYHAMTVLMFPSYREGFPNVVLEAAAAGVPTVGYRSTGTVDAIIDGETGVLVPVGDAAGLGDALATYVLDPDLARAHGDRARRRVEADFTPATIWHELVQEYEAALSGANR